MVRFKRFCSRCGELFQPRGKYSSVCDGCYRKKYKNVFGRFNRQEPKLQYENN